MSFILKKINYDNRTVTLYSDDGKEVTFTFEFFQDINKYITREWVWDDNMWTVYNYGIRDIV